MLYMWPGPFPGKRCAPVPEVCQGEAQVFKEVAENAF
jgi:hypothetical protein